MSSDNATKTDLLSLKDRLNKLDAMADDPWGHDPVEWDGAYADAIYEARACKGMAMGAQAHDIAKRFKRAGKRFHACRALDLVPAEKAVSFSMDVRVAKAEPIGPGEPVPPPPTKLGNHPLAPAYLYAARCPKAAAEMPFFELDEDAKARWRVEAAQYNADYFACPWPKP